MADEYRRRLPKRLRIDFRSTLPSYELYTKKGCNRRDLLTAGFSEDNVSALLWNSYSKKEMRYTLIRPEEWFWTDREWWKEKSPHLDAMYEASGGAFSDLAPPRQAELLGVEYLAMTGSKARGNQWWTADGLKSDIVRYTRERLIEDGFDMAPAFPENLNLVVVTHCKETYGKEVRFIRDGAPDEAELRRLARMSVRDFSNDPGRVWDRNGDYYYAIMNGFRAIKDFGHNSMLETIRVISKETFVGIYEHFWSHQTYENQMRQPALSPLIGRRGGQLKFFFVTQKANFGSPVSGFVRDYALPLGLSVCLIQMSPEK